MADKGFILTVVAVLAVAILAGGLRNSYSGALSVTQGYRSGGAPVIGDTPAAYYRGNLQQYKSPYQQAVAECRRMYDQGLLEDYTDYRNCVEDAARSGIRRTR